MKIKENFLNYILTIGFIFLILIFLVSMIFVTRYSLQDENVVKDYVQNTKNLIDDINEVEKSVDKSDEINSQLNSNDLTNIRYTNFDKDVVDLNYLNFKKKKGVITLMFDSEIDVYEDIYYLKLEGNLTLNEKDIIIFNTQTLPKIGKIISENSLLEYNVLMFESQKIDKIKKSQIFGKVILKYG